MPILRFEAWKKKYFNFDKATLVIRIKPHYEDKPESIIKLNPLAPPEHNAAWIKSFADTFYSEYVTNKIIRKARYGESY